MTYTPEQSVEMQRGAAALGVNLDPSALDRFARFADLLAEANQRLNLTRVPDQEVVPRHFLDSLALAVAMRPEPGSRIIDVGTGAGFPGIPLALAFPKVSVMLLDGTRKRLAFIDTVLADLQVSNARTLHGRAEELARSPSHRESYDLVVARAVAGLNELAPWLLPLVRRGGAAVAYKSRDVDVELEAAAGAILLHGGVLEHVVAVAIPGTDIVRKLIIMRKSGPAAPSPSARSPRGRRRDGTR